MYFPVVVQWVLLTLYYRSATLPFLANPSISLAGMVGEPKSQLMSQASDLAKEMILPWVMFEKTNESIDHQAGICLTSSTEKGIELPFVCKPDIGCRGAGVKLIQTRAQLESTIASYPEGTRFLCQKLASYEPEMGIFYVKNPHTKTGDIVSMTLKTFPTVTGDGTSSLGDLIEQDSRASLVKNLYYERHKSKWHDIPEAGEKIRLVFSGSHSKGAIFTNGETYKTEALTNKINEVMEGLPDFYYGRLDVKFSDFDSLKRGENLEIVEINGASSEATHIWDKDTKFLDAIKALLWQYRTLFKIGAYHRKQGKTPPRFSHFLREWQEERRLVQSYPVTD